MKSTVLSGFNNVYSLSALGMYICTSSFLLSTQMRPSKQICYISVITTFGGMTWIIVHHLTFYLQNKQQASNINSCKNVPASIYIFALIMTSLSSYHYIKNTALRQFALKYIKQKMLYFTFKRFTLIPATSCSGSFNSVPESRLFTINVHPSNIENKNFRSVYLEDIKMLNISRIQSEEKITVENIEMDENYLNTAI